MRFLVTGGAGFIGSALIRYLMSHEDHEVLNLDKLTYAGNLLSLADIADSSRYRFVQMDICDATGVRSVMEEFRPDKIMHLAAESHVDRSVDEPGEFIQTNVIGTFTLLDAALDYWRQHPNDDFLFHHVSTDEVFGSLGSDGYFTETTPYDPRSPYSASKASSDHLVRAWGATYGLPFVLTNCSNNYGQYQFPEKLIPLAVLNALHEKPIPVYGKGENVRDWLHVEDHARALWTILSGAKPGENFNVGGNAERRNIDLVHRLCDILDEARPRDGGAGHRDLITFVADRPGHDMRYAIDATRIRDRLGWSPNVDLDEGLRQTITWYLDNPDWWQPIVKDRYAGERLGLDRA